MANKKNKPTQAEVEKRIEELKKTPDLYHNDEAMQELLLLRGIKQAPIFREHPNEVFLKAVVREQKAKDGQVNNTDEGELHGG